MSTITSTNVLIDVLGGNQRVAALIEGATPSAVSGWRSKKRLPAATYIVLKTKILKMGLDAPDSLWTMRKPTRREAIQRAIDSYKATTKPKRGKPKR